MAARIFREAEQAADTTAAVRTTAAATWAWAAAITATAVAVASTGAMAVVVTMAATSGAVTTAAARCISGGRTYFILQVATTVVRIGVAAFGMAWERVGLDRRPVVDLACLSRLGLDCATMGLERLGLGLAGGLLDRRGLTPLFVACLSFASAAAADSPQAVGDCASVTASALFKGDGYRHVVTLSNSCPRAVSCEVWTDVDPLPHVMLQAKPGASAEVITRNGSPAREVHAGKLCHFTL